MIEQDKVICKADSVLAELGFHRRKLIGVQFFDDREPELSFLQVKDPRYVVRYKNLEVEEGCVVDDGDSLLCVEVDCQSGNAKFLQPFE